MIAEIRRIHRAGGSLRPKKVPAKLQLAARRFFKTWEAAVRKAGFNYEEVTGVRHWTREKVIERIQEVAAAGVPLHATYIKQNYYFLYRAAVMAFPNSWAKALRAAGFDPREHRTPLGRWDREQAESWVRNRVTNGKSILSHDTPQDLRDFVRKRLGMTWTAFVESLGIPYPGVKKRLDWTKAKLISEIRRWQAEGHRMNYRAVKAEYQALIHQARKFFGSWDAALAAAGVDVFAL